MRTSLRGSKKLQALESVCEDRTFPTGEPKGFVNEAYDIDGDRLSHPLLDITLQKPVGKLMSSFLRYKYLHLAYTHNMKENIIYNHFNRYHFV